MSATSDRQPVYYHDYLQLDRLLDAQHPLSTEHGRHAHDELLFIIVHQAYELWFKQILHELEAVRAVFDQPTVPERSMGRVVGHLERVHAVQRVLIDHLEVLETMTPLDFLEFRDLLVPASGFQSLQFRLIENLFGLDPDRRLPINASEYVTRFSEEHRALLEESHRRRSLFDLVEAWLERTPFLQVGEYAFWDHYREAVDTVLAGERVLIEGNPNLSEEGRKEQLVRFDATAATYASLFDDTAYADLQEQGHRRLGRKAFLAALLINLYRDEPMLHLPFRVLQSLLDVDEGFTAWRDRHALMVSRMIGGRIGTGGTSGHEYLEQTARRHKVWADLYDLATYYIPRTRLPDLPPSVVETMRFHFDVAGAPQPAS
jgi:tryptophan 2,3-dioxygenase